MTKTDISGACRCGQLKYSVTKPPLLSGYCHCSACQRRTSGPCAGFVMIEGKSCRLDGDFLTYTETGGSGKSMIEHRCSACGTTVYTVLAVLKDVIALAASTLSENVSFQPERHVWVSKRDPHFEIADELPQELGPPKVMMSYLA